MYKFLSFVNHRISYNYKCEFLYKNDMKFSKSKNTIFLTLNHPKKRPFFLIKSDFCKFISFPPYRFIQSCYFSWSGTKPDVTTSFRHPSTGTHPSSPFHLQI